MPVRTEITGPDWCGDSSRKLIRLDQGWSVADADWFYWTTQGSQLLPYAFFLALEQADGAGLFREARNMQKYRFLPEAPSPVNPDGLPVGVVAAAESSLPPELIADRRSVGFTCAVCHTSNINYKGTAMRVDGTAAANDMAGFLVGLAAALQATVHDEAKFDRFAEKVLGKQLSEKKKSALRSTLRTIADRHSAYNTLNHSEVSGGFGRLDAFGRIYNNALTLVDPKNGIKANAPVNFPQLWDSTREDFVQWTGVASNKGVGPLMRNLGQAVGVFAAVDPGNPPPSRGYASSVNMSNLRALETSLKRLKSPVWPEQVFPPINRGLASAGRAIFIRDCRGCHQDVERNGRDRIFTTKVPLATIRTDALAAENLVNHRGSTGFLAGTKQSIYFGEPFGATDTAFHITRNTVLHIFAGKVAPRSLNKRMGRRAVAKEEEEEAPADREEIATGKNEPQLQYKARPLNGVWAVAPYLHNGSVPNLYEMLLPAHQRSRQFSVGRREFDPVKVGFVTEPAEGTFLFDTTLKGNTNTGHEFGARLSDAERWQVIEYLKTL